MACTSTGASMTHASHPIDDAAIIPGSDISPAGADNLAGAISRRSAMTIMTAIVAAPAGAAVPTLAMPSSSAAWDAAMRALLDAKCEADAFEPFYSSVAAAYEAGRPSMDSIHWAEFQFEDRYHVARDMDLEGRWMAFLKAEGTSWWANSKERADEVKARYRAALDSVQAFRDAEAKIGRESGMNSADERIEELADAECDAKSVLMAMPAPHLAALRWKLDKLMEPDDGGDSTASWSRAYVQQTIADYHRLLGGA